MLLNGRVDESNDKLCGLVQYLAVLRADNIRDEKELAEHIGQMKSSEAFADSECKVAKKQAGELREDIHRIEIYLNNKDGQFPNQEWLEVCKRSAEKYGVVDVGGLDRLNAALEDITKKAKGLEVRRQFYCCKAREFLQVRNTIFEIWKGEYAEKIIRGEYDKTRLERENDVSKKIRK